MNQKKFQKNLRSDCPVAGTLDIIGDRWTLLVVRDLLKGKKRYGEFLESGEKIPTNILASRLKTLESAGLIEKIWYNERPPRAEYRLTESGQELGQIVLAMLAWGNKNVIGKAISKTDDLGSVDV